MADREISSVENDLMQSYRCVVVTDKSLGKIEILIDLPLSDNDLSVLGLNPTPLDAQSDPKRGSYRLDLEKSRIAEENRLMRENRCICRVCANTGRVSVLHEFPLSQRELDTLDSRLPYSHVMGYK